jgi:hypothetical protein
MVEHGSEGLLLESGSLAVQLTAEGYVEVAAAVGVAVAVGIAVVPHANCQIEEEAPLGIIS